MNAPPPQAAPRKGLPTWVIVILCLAGAAIVVLPVLAVVGVYGVRKYIANAKTAEARYALGQIAKDAAVAYEKNHALCPSASHPVPASMTSLKGTNYQSTAAEWAVDKTRNAGFACLEFSMDMPQYYQYSYAVSLTNPPTFTATAHGDLNGDGQTSEFVIRGEVKNGVLTVAPRIDETDPEE